MSKVALITGITGQDGSYLAELLLDKNYCVHGTVRRASNINRQRIDHINTSSSLYLHYSDLTDCSNILNILSLIKNKYKKMECLEIYNLAAMSHVKVSFTMSEYCGNVNGLGVGRILDAVKSLQLEKITRFYQASTSEMYGKVLETPQTEKTQFNPQSPYAISKLYGYWITKLYREAYGMFTCNGILFNHESPRRGPTFITRKITIGLGKILKGEQDKLVLGNLNAKRDWGHARDYVEAMWRMLQGDKPDDYVVATGENHSVREFVEKAFALKDIHILWKGTGIKEVGYDANTDKELICISEEYFRPCEVETLIGDYSKLNNILKWKPTISFENLVEEMVEYDCK